MLNLLNKNTTFNSYHLAAILSFLSVLFGIGREFLIVGLLGFSSTNDQLQIYLSIFYSIALSIDAIRLAGLNLFTQMTLPRIIICATIVSLPFSILLGLLMSILTGHLNFTLLSIAILGSFLNLITALIITYKQRYGAFMSAQIINLLPNFILIPGILLANTLIKDQLILSIVSLCCLIPILQLLLLVFVSLKTKPEINFQASIKAGIWIFMRHGLSMLGEQLFQLTTRAAFFKLNAGYLSLLAMSVRVYAAARFVLIDTFIGAKLANWQSELPATGRSLLTFLHANRINILVLLLSGWVIIFPAKNLIYFFVELCSLLLFSFYFNTLIRIAYYKINHSGHDANLVVRFGIYELFFAIAGYVLIKTNIFPLMLFMWCWYVAKPYAQLLLLRPKYNLLCAVIPDMDCPGSRTARMQIK